MIYESDSNTMVSKFQQDVFDIFSKKFPVVATMSDYSDFIEKDVLVTEILDFQNLQTTLVNTRIAVEVNGLYHYPRNSTNLVGRDQLKKKILKSLGYTYLDVPYYDWNVVADDQREVYLYNKLLDAAIKKE